MSLNNIPLKIKSSQRSKKRNGQRHGDNSFDKELAPKSRVMDEATFKAALAEADARPVVKNPQDLTTEDIQDGIHKKTKVTKATPYVPPTPQPAPLTVSFSAAAKISAGSTSSSQSRSCSSSSASSQSTMDFPLRGASSAPAVKKAPATVLNIKAVSNPMKTSIVGKSSAWATVGLKTSKTTNSMPVPVKQDVWASKTTSIPPVTAQATVEVFPSSDFGVVVPKKKQAVTSVPSPMAESMKAAISKPSQGNGGWVEVTVKKQKMDKKLSCAFTNASKALNNKFEALLSVPKSKAPTTPISKKRQQTVEEPVAPRPTSGSSFGGLSSISTNDTTLKKKARNERKKLSRKAPAVESKSVYRLSGNDLPTETIVSLPGKSLAASKQGKQDAFQTQMVVPSPSTSSQVLDTIIAPSDPPRFVGPKAISSTVMDLVKSKIMELEKIEVGRRSTIAPASSTGIKMATSAVEKKASDSVSWPQETYSYSTLESRLFLCHGSDDDEAEVATVVLAEDLHVYTTMESRFGLQHMDEFEDEVEFVVPTKEYPVYVIKESSFTMQESHVYSTMESRFSVQHMDDFYEDSEHEVESLEDNDEQDTTFYTAQSSVVAEEETHGEHTTTMDFEKPVESDSKATEHTKHLGKTERHNEQSTTFSATHDGMMNETTIKIAASAAHDEAVSEKTIETNTSSDEEVNEPIPDRDDDNTVGEDQHPHPIFLGTIAINAFLSQLRGRTSTTYFAASSIVCIFTAFAAYESMLLGGAALPVYSTEGVLSSTTAQHRIKLGHTKLSDLLDSVRFEHGVGSLDAVTTALEVAAEKEGVLMQGVGRQVEMKLEKWL